VKLFFARFGAEIGVVGIPVAIRCPPLNPTMEWGVFPLRFRESGCITFMEEELCMKV
jgi:hypothetical protein